MSKWIWILISGLGAPAIEYMVGVMRFGADNADTTYLQALEDFGLFGLVAGWLFFFFRGRAANDRQRFYSALGFGIASPIALFLAWGSGLFLPPVIGAVLFGGIPLLIGGWLGSLNWGMKGAG